MAYDPKKPSVYLDWSHLSNAFSAIDEPVASAAHKALSDAVLQCASEGNLCLSVVHMAELTAFPENKRAYGRALASWLDTLNLTWVECASDGLWYREREAALLMRLGAQHRAYRPFRHSLASMFRDAVSPAQLAYIEQSPAIATWFEDTRGHGGAAALRQQSLESARLWCEDTKKGYARGEDEQHQRTKLATKERQKLRELLRAAAHSMLVRRIYRTAGLDDPNTSAIEAACDAVLNDSEALPAFRIRCAVTREFRFWVANQNSAGAKFQSRHLSAGFDHEHCAVGAAYCDVFTCDHRTSKHLGSARKLRGRQPQLSTSDDRTAPLAAEILRQLKKATL